jgi:aldehyde dehydrogenase (NAD+)
MIAERAISSDAEILAVFEEQRRRYRAAPFPPFEERARRLDKLERAIRRRREDLRAALYADFRKPVPETEFTEYLATLTELKFARARLRRWMRPQRVATPLSLWGSNSEVRYEPKGVALILAPWNYPFYLTLVPLIAALAAGNRCLVRPSEKAPATREVIAAIIAEAFPKHEVATVGGEVETAEALLKLPFDHYFFTGSTRVGKLVMKAAAEHLAGVTLELGGKSPAIVDASADIERAASRIAWGKFVNAGQTCVAPDYVLVHESREREFLDKTVEHVSKMYGTTDDERVRTPDYARMIDGNHFARIGALLESTVRGGARVETGGKADASERYIAPTVLSNVGFDAPIMSEEIFGPVLPVLSFRNLDDALAKINARPKPLALYAFSRKAAVIERILRGTSAGGTLVNDTLLHLANPYLPFGGVGESGVGSYHGFFGFKAFSHERAVMQQTPASVAGLLAPPYGRAAKMLIAALERFSA